LVDVAVSGGATNRGAESLTHQALLYGSAEDFLAGIVPLVQKGLESGDLIRIAATDGNAGRLRAALGADTGRVMFDDRIQCYRHPVRTLATLHRTVQQASRAGQRLRLIGEPRWSARTAQQSKEWARYESLVNAALAWSNAAMVCTYDTRLVDSRILTDVARTHPAVVINGAARSSPSYLDPVVFNTECDRAPLPEPPLPARSVSFDSTDQLAISRSFVTSHATEAGAAEREIEQFVQAVNEVAINAIEYGGGSGVMQIWTGPRALVCEVTDMGAGLRDPLAGRLPAGRSTARGRRLWLARQLCDLLELRTGPAGTAVRLHLNLPENGGSDEVLDKGGGRRGELDSGQRTVDDRQLRRDVSEVEVVEHRHW
jgi:anti-sigma regulatory factor (Ser/Thr protein kinase)